MRNYHWSSLAHADEDNQSVASTGYTRKPCILLLILSGSDMRKQLKFVPDLTYTFPPQSINRRISKWLQQKTAHNEKFPLSSLHLKARLQKCGEQEFCITNTSNRDVSVTPQRKNTTEQEVVHVYSCENSNTL